MLGAHCPFATAPLMPPSATATLPGRRSTARIAARLGRASTWRNVLRALAVGAFTLADIGDRRARAAIQYGMPEAAVNVESPIGSGDGFALPGFVDKGAEGIKTFLCRYSAARTLSDVMATTPDGE